ncbi:MAG: starch-binding protein [Prevotella sp.]|nr:starch-binding protein [Prevotella sp.]
MKKILFRMLAAIFILCGTIKVQAQGWPQDYGGVMLQGFYWDSYGDSQWASLEKQADDLASSFDLVWVPQSGNCGGTSMGYDDLWWFNNYNSTFGTEAELRSMIKTFKEKGIGTIADVVINHRKNMSNWVDFPRETYKGIVYEMKSTDICANDDGGATKKWATDNGFSLSANNDTGEGWDGMRDLDHKSENVQNIVKAYLKFLLEDLGYAGFRYDMVKGYAATYTKLYNEDSKPQFSVGEYWDGNATTVKNWINNTDKTSAAFDFPFRYTVRNALRGSANDKDANNWKQDPDYRLLSSTSITSDADYRQYAVTFVENHDTEYRSSTAQQDPIRKDTLAANAFLLAMPGTPCVFYKHWQTYKSEIKAMIEARKLAGITNTSTYSSFRNNKAYYANTIKVNNENRLLVVVGDEKQVEPNTNQWTKILSGYHYAYYLANDMNTAWADKGSGDFKEAFDVTLTAVSNTAGAKLVYTLDGSEPSATNGTQVASGSSIKIEGEKDVTLKVGLLIGSAVSGIITRTYIYKEEEKLPEAVCIVNEGEVCAFFEAPANWDKTIYCWAWNSSPGENFTYANGGWPGVPCQLLGVAENGNKVWKWTWDGTKQSNTSVEKPGMIIFSNFGSPQTEDLTFQLGGYYNEKGLQKTIDAGIEAITIGNGHADRVYTLDGRQVSTDGNMDNLPKGVYIVNKKKIIVK